MNRLGMPLPLACLGWNFKRIKNLSNLPIAESLLSEFPHLLGILQLSYVLYNVPALNFLAIGQPPFPFLVAPALPNWNAVELQIHQNSCSGGKNLGCNSFNRILRLLKLAKTLLTQRNPLRIAKTCYQTIVLQILEIYSASR